MTSASHKLRPLVFVGANLMVALAIYVGGVAPIASLFDRQRSLIEQRMATLEQFRGMAARQGASDAARASLAGVRGEFLSGKSEGSIVAELQTRLKQLAQSNGAHVRVTRALPARLIDGSSWAGSQIEVAGPVAAIAKFAYAIETTQPYLFVSAATVRVPMAQVRQLEQIDAGVELQMDIFGSMAIEGERR